MISMSQENAEKILKAFETDDWMQKMEASRILRTVLKEQQLKHATEATSVDDPRVNWLDYWVESVGYGIGENTHDN